MHWEAHSRSCHYLTLGQQVVSLVAWDSNSVLWRQELILLHLSYPQRGYTYRVMDSLNRKYDGVVPPFFPNFQMFLLRKNLSWWKSFRTVVVFFLVNCWSTQLLKKKCEGSTFIKNFLIVPKGVFSPFADWGQICTEKKTCKRLF